MCRPVGSDTHQTLDTMGQSGIKNVPLQMQEKLAMFSMNLLNGAAICLRSCDDFTIWLKCVPYLHSAILQCTDQRQRIFNYRNTFKTIFTFRDIFFTQYILRNIHLYVLLWSAMLFV